MDLDQVLTILRKHGVVSAEVPGPGGVILRVVFGPDAVPVGDTPTPGGWKSPVKLDDPAQYDEAP